MYNCCSTCDYYHIYTVPEQCAICPLIEIEKKEKEVALLDNGDKTSSNE